MIKATLIGVTVYSFAIAILFFALKSYVMGVLLLISAALNALFFYWWRHRIPLAAVILETVCSVIRRFHSMLNNYAYF